jgi:hypothetical protein
VALIEKAARSELNIKNSSDLNYGTAAAFIFNWSDSQFKLNSELLLHRPLPSTAG